MISGSKSPYSPIQNPASERSERAIIMSISVIFIIFRHFFCLAVGKNDRDLPEFEVVQKNDSFLYENDSFFSNFFFETEINRSWGYFCFTRYFSECFYEGNFGGLNFSFSRSNRNRRVQ